MTHPLGQKIYHIVHWDRIRPIAAAGGLLSDVELGLANPGTTIGMSDIKARRLRLDVTCYDDLKVGACVPFYFCPRSVMLYLLHRSNHPNLNYNQGQTPIVHLEFDLKEVREWAEAQPLRWAFTTSNAGAFYTEHYSDVAEMKNINWRSVEAANWRDSAIKEAKQAEFLVEKNVPWKLIQRIGVYDKDMVQRVSRAIPLDAHRPTIAILPNWYY
jgi:ssDNA thymidine ADP-ribosyltransferase, DarT